MRTFDRSDYTEAGEVEAVAENKDFQECFISENKDELQRKLGNRQIQLLAIGGSIGTVW